MTERTDFELTLIVTGAVGGAISFLLGLFIFLVYVHNEMPLNPIKWSLLSIAMFTLCSLGLPLYYSLILDSPLMTISLLLFWTFGTVFVYLLFYKRFEKTFIGTKYDTFSSNKRNLYIFYALLCLFVLLDIVSKLLYILPVTDEQYNVYTLIITIVQQCIDFTLSFGLIGLFVHKLKSLNHDIETAKRVSVYEHNQTQYQASQLKILVIQSKVTLLSSITILSSQIYLTYKAVLFVLETFCEYEVSDIEIWIFDGFLPIDCLLNTVCIFLSFDFNHKCYLKVCCCHYKWSKLVYGKQYQELSRHSMMKKTSNALEMRLLGHADQEDAAVSADQTDSATCTS